MLSRIAVPVLCAAAVIFACAPRPHAASSKSVATPLSMKGVMPAAPKPRKPKIKPEELARVPLASSLDVAVATSSAKDVRFALHVTNRADHNLELMFPSGQTHEFVVRDEAGREVWRWSEGRMFTQALQSKLLAGEETTTYAESWQPGTRAGRFTVVATLRSSSHVVEQTAEFIVP
jgi:hypothetical protein